MVVFWWRNLFSICIINILLNLNGGQAHFQFQSHQSIKKLLAEDMVNFENGSRASTFKSPHHLSFVQKEKLLSFNLKFAVQSGQFLELDKAGLLYDNVANQLCVDHMRHFISQVSSFPLMFSPIETTTDEEEPPALWAIQMLDAWGGVPDGILSGHTSSPGDFPECLQIRGDYIDPTTNQKSTFKGRYIASYLVPLFSASDLRTKELVETLKMLKVSNDVEEFDLDDDDFNESKVSRETVSPSELLAMIQNYLGILMLPTVGTCFPSSCDVQDVQSILNNSVSILTHELVHPSVIYDTTDEKPPFDSGDVTMLVVLIVIVGCCLVGTALDLFMVWKNICTQKKGLKAIMAFSVYTNTKRFLQTKNAAGGGDNFGCMHGLRFLSMCWVVLFHTFLMLYKGIVWNSVDVKKMYSENWTIQVLLNGFVSVDTFFTISGTLASYNMLKTLDKTKGKINVPLLYIHRYLRLTPTYMIVVGIIATLLPYISDGPGWYRVLNDNRACKNNWWHNILYITNLVKYTAGKPGTCLGEGWYLSNDMQFFLLSPFLIYPLWRWRRAGLFLLGALSLVSIVTPAVITGVKDLPPTYTVFTDMKTYETDVYHKPWTRIGPYLVGLFLGYVLHGQSKSQKHGPKGHHHPLSKKALFVSWTISTLVAMTIVFGVHSYFDPTRDQDTDGAFIGAILYAGLHRFVWGIIISWIIWACVKGQGGWVNSILSWPPFVPLGRLTFCVYISSLHVQLTFHTTTMHAWHYSIYIYVNMFFAHLVMCLLVGYFLHIAVESPFIQLEKLVFNRDGQSKSPIVQSSRDASSLTPGGAPVNDLTTTIEQPLSLQNGNNHKIDVVINKK